MDGSTPFSELIDRAYELAREARMDHEQTVKLRVLVAEAHEQGRIDAHASQRDPAAPA